MSEDGTKQDNAVYGAVQQLVNAFVPLALATQFAYNIDFRNIADGVDPRSYQPDATAIIPVVVTNARLYRLRPDVTDIDLIREARSPADVADEVPWTWCFHDVPQKLLQQNVAAVEEHRQIEGELVHRFHGVNEQMERLVDRPNWLAVVNINHLQAAASALELQFKALPTLPARHFLQPTVKRRRRKRAV